MILLIDRNNIGRHLKLADDMFRVRASVFKTRLNWDVTVDHEREIDVFDGADPIYVLSVCERTGRLRGSVRLLRTTAPNMLRDVFPELLCGGDPVVCPSIWESSRFSIDAAFAHERCGDRERGEEDGEEARAHGARFVRRTTIELLLGMIECAQANGVSRIVSVHDARMVRLFRQLDCRSEPVGAPRRIGDVMTHAALFDASDAQWRRIAAVAGVETRLLPRPDLSRRASAPRRAADHPGHPPHAPAYREGARA